MGLPGDAKQGTLRRNLRWLPRGMYQGKQGCVGMSPKTP
jgi:hypothetical protein